MLKSAISNSIDSLVPVNCGPESMPARSAKHSITVWPVALAPNVSFPTFYCIFWKFPPHLDALLILGKPCARIILLA